MKKQITKKLPAFISILIISILIFNGSCSKDTKSLDNGNTTTGTSKIIYTDVKPDSAIGSYNLDLNNDGITDFVFSISNKQIVCDPNPMSGNSLLFFNILSLTPSNGNNEIITDGTSTLALDSSSAIISDSLWTTASQTLIDWSSPGTGRCSTFPAGGHWLNVSDKYLGLKFIKNNNTYYGWARLTSSSKFATSPAPHLVMVQLILKDYAYNSIPNQTILAGQTK